MRFPEWEMPGHVFRLFFRLLNSWRAMFTFRGVFSSLCFNSCTEAGFEALVQLSLARLSEAFTKKIAFLTAVLDLAVS